MCSDFMMGPQSGYGIRRLHCSCKTERMRRERENYLETFWENDLEKRIKAENPVECRKCSYTPKSSKHGTSTTVTKHQCSKPQRHQYKYTSQTVSITPVIQLYNLSSRGGRRRGRQSQRQGSLGACRGCKQSGHERRNCPINPWQWTSGNTGLATTKESESGVSKPESCFSECLGRSKL